MQVEEWSSASVTRISCVAPVEGWNCSFGIFIYSSISPSLSCTSLYDLRLFSFGQGQSFRIIITRKLCPTFLVNFDLLTFAPAVTLKCKISRIARRRLESLSFSIHSNSFLGCSILSNEYWCQIIANVTGQSFLRNRYNWSSAAMYISCQFPHIRRDHTCCLIHLREG